MKEPKQADIYVPRVQQIQYEEYKINVLIEGYKE